MSNIPLYSTWFESSRLIYQSWFIVPIIWLFLPDNWLICCDMNPCLFAIRAPYAIVQLPQEVSSRNVPIWERKICVLSFVVSSLASTNDTPRALSCCKWGTAKSSLSCFSSSVNIWTIPGSLTIWVLLARLCSIFRLWNSGNFRQIELSLFLYHSR